jgi:GT2 family glycosyltransferase
MSGANRDVDRAITLAIPTYNRREDLARCLESCARWVPNCKILVVDDGGTDGTDRMLKQDFPNVACIRYDDNKGPAYARNVAIEAAKTPYVAFFDSDVVFISDWYEAIHRRLSPDTILAGRVEKPDGTLEWGPRKIMPWGGSLPCAPERANAASSNNMVVPVALARSIGGFSEELRIYFEDSFFCIRALRAGYKVRYVDDALVAHHHDSQLNTKRKQMLVRNRSCAMIRASRSPLAMALLQVGVTMVESVLAMMQNRSGMARACVYGLADGAWRAVKVGKADKVCKNVRWS